MVLLKKASADGGALVHSCTARALGPVDPAHMAARRGSSPLCDRRTRTSCRSCTGFLQFPVTSVELNITEITESIHRRGQTTPQHEHSRIASPVQRNDDNCHRKQSPLTPAQATFSLLRGRRSLSSSSAIKATQRGDDFSAYWFSFSPFRVSLL